MSIVRVVALVAVPTLLFSATLFAQEKKIQRLDLPPAVEKTVVAQSKRSEIRGFRRRPKMAKSVMRLS
jgi:hypothetical protein